MKSRTAWLLAGLFLIGQAQAMDTGDKRWSLALGGYLLADFDSTLSLEDSQAGAGIAISPTRTLGMDFENTVLRFDGLRRLKGPHSLTFSWYSIRSDGNKSIEEEFTWEDDNGNSITIPVGAQVTSRLKYDIFKLGYRWSFYHSDKVELAVGAGVHVTRFEMNLEASTTVPAGRSARGVETTVPLPVVAFTLAYRISPRWSWSLDNQWFAMRFGEYSGNYTDVTLRLEYRAWKNVGLGVGIGSNNLTIGRENDDYRFTFRNRIAGGLLYLTTWF